MKLKREIIAILLIICVLFTISSINAADSGEEAVGTVNETVGLTEIDESDYNNLAKSNDDVEILSEGNIGTFTNLKNNISNSVNYLELNDDFELSTTTDGAVISNIGIDIQKTLTIDGKGHYIDAKEKTNVFNIFSKVTLKNIIFKNGKSSYGGCLYYYTSSIFFSR